MTVAELLELLEDLDPEAEVLLATQPSWPMQYHVRGVVDGRDVAEQVLEDEDDDDELRIRERVYLVEGSAPDEGPYCPGAVFERR